MDQTLGAEPERSAPVALLVDFDNCWATGRFEKTGSVQAEPALILACNLHNFASQFGTVGVAKVYASGTYRVKAMAGTFERCGYDVMFAGKPYKDADILMSFDGQDILLTRPDIETYVIVSGDSDFIRLGEAIVAKGKSLIIVAPESAASRALRALATSSVPLESCLGQESADFPRTQNVSLRKRHRPRAPLQKPAEKVRLRVFLCHSRYDKLKVRDLYVALNQQSYVRPWLDEESLLPGADWELEIGKAVRTSHCVIVCLSRRAMGSSGYLHKEIRFALDVADRQPEGRIFLIPVKLEECDVPERLCRYHWVELFRPGGYELLLRSLRALAEDV